MTAKTWFGGTGAFSNAGDWSPAGVPVAGDTATLLTGTLQVTDQDLSGIPLTLGGNIGTKPILDLEDSILGTVSVITGATPSASGLHTINVSGYAVFEGPVATNELFDSTTINISPRSLLLNESSLQFIDNVSGSLSITGSRGALLANNGLIEQEGAGSAQLTIAPNIVGTGTILVGAGNTATTEFGGLVGSGQTFEFSGFGKPPGPTSKATLQLDRPGAFQATIANFSNLDTIDLKGVAVTSDIFSNGVLTLKNGTQTVASLHFAGSYSTSDFVTQIVGNDTLIKHI